MMSLKQEKKRLQLIDLIRGITIVGMISYHFFMGLDALIRCRSFLVLIEWCLYLATIDLLDIYIACWILLEFKQESQQKRVIILIWWGLDFIDYTFDFAQ